MQQPTEKTSRSRGLLVTHRRDRDKDRKKDKERSREKIRASESTSRGRQCDQCQQAPPRSAQELMPFLAAKATGTRVAAPSRRAPQCACTGGRENTRREYSPGTALQMPITNKERERDETTKLSRQEYVVVFGCHHCAANDPRERERDVRVR
jgi:hypothetical protein